MKRTTQLQQLLKSSTLDFMMEAHNGLSARIVEETGFNSIWASSFSISAACGVRDNNELSWTQVLDVAEQMADATTIPILLDGDTGYGNFNNVQRLVKKLERCGIAGVCLEDKIFPKMNSFVNSEKQPLEDTGVFCGKIKAAKDVQQDDDFVVVARTEALIAGYGLDEALKRAERYHESGADAILVHSKENHAEEIDAFMKAWGDRHPVIIIPTTYHQTPVKILKEMSVSLIIWANHNVRAATSAMMEVSEKIFKEQSIANIDSNVASMKSLFQLQGMDKLMEAEKRYLCPKDDEQI